MVELKEILELLGKAYSVGEEAVRREIANLLKGKVQKIEETKEFALFGRLSGRGDFVILSAHVDLGFPRKSFWLEVGEVVRGTLDNVVGVSALLHAALKNGFPSTTLLGFTSREEKDKMGARRLMEFVARNLPPVYKKLGLVITVDVTTDNYPLPLSVEHRFVEKEPLRNRLKFRKVADFEDFVRYCLEGMDYGWAEHAEEDESSAYAEFDLNVVSLCLPVKLLGPSLHSPEGQEVDVFSVVKYGEGLSRFARRAVEFSLRVRK